jgi:hypothetical protein
MSVTVTCTVTPSAKVTRTNVLATGVSGGDINATLPSSLLGSIAVGGGASVITTTKAWVGEFALSASTPVDLDLSALVGGQGDTAFTAVKLLYVMSLETAAAAKDLKLGGSTGASEWYDPVGEATGDKLRVPSGTARMLYHLGTGFAVGTRHVLRLDPGTNAQSVLVLIAGD